MSGSAIADALVTMLGAASAFGSEAVSKDDYACLERASGSAVMVQPEGFSNIVLTFGAPTKKHVTWQIGLEVYVKDTGDPAKVLNRLWSVQDVIKGVIDSDDTALGTAKKVVLDRGTRPRDTYTEAGGATWLPYYMTILAEEF